MEKSIITISREYGSGGRLVGKTLAKMLNIPFMIMNLLHYLPKKQGFHKTILKNQNLPL